METTVKIKKLQTSRLNNAEYSAFMTGVRKLITSATPEKLLIDSDTLSMFDTGLKNFSDLIIRLRSYEGTAEMSEIDSSRDHLLNYLRSTVRSGSKLPLAAQKEAGVKLLALLKPYGNIAQRPNQQETELIDALLYDFAKPEYSAHITALGLDNVVTELKNINARYKTLSVTRTESRANEALETGKALRLEIDKVYDKLQSLAFAAFLTSPSTEASEFVASLNQLIEEIKTLHKLRRSKSKTEEDTNKIEQPGQQETT